MSQVGNLARRLIDYDRATAEVVLAALEAEVGDLQQAEGDPTTTTQEWKTQFAQHERMRALALELSQLLH